MLVIRRRLALVSSLLVLGSMLAGCPAPTVYDEEEPRSASADTVEAPTAPLASSVSPGQTVNTQLPWQWNVKGDKETRWDQLTTHGLQARPCANSSKADPRGFIDEFTRLEVADKDKGNFSLKHIDIWTQGEGMLYEKKAAPIMICITAVRHGAVVRLLRALGNSSNQRTPLTRELAGKWLADLGVMKFKTPESWVVNDQNAGSITLISTPAYWLHTQEAYEYSVELGIAWDPARAGEIWAKGHRQAEKSDEILGG